MITKAIGLGSNLIISKIVWLVSVSRISPNMLTAIGLLVNVMAAFLLGYGQFFWGGWVIIGAGLFDLIDGRVARALRSETPFGAFFDSVIDRYSDIILFIGLVTYYARTSQISYLVLTCIVLMGAVMTSYTRARAESIIGSCKIGFLERPERIVLLIIGAFSARIGGMEKVLWVMLILSHWTAIARIYYTWKQTKTQAINKHAH